ncbi:MULTISPECIES: roadblock/LC7 domain-containing protein [Streptomyces]|uniref:Roadblock/LC7 domain-containing protein n=1 Tax=Streptomyces indiaensis TaxID=284033 RepID=A0ABP5RA65_9ACTN|nr:roadblock/LC7 domain-containing protein [Streptomyces indiaensis]MCF1648818.1 roadblock/LC7 domain-containing protein [Streptomyces indiaensis]
MAVETDVQDELRRLRTRIPRLTGSLAATVDGLVLAHDVPDTEPEGLAALTAAALGVAYRMTDAAARGDFRELLVRGSRGYVATYAAGTTAVLTLLAEDRVNVGRLHLEGRRSGARIADLLATRVGPGTGRHAERQPPEEHLATATPATDRPIGTLPVRTPQRPTHQPRPQTGL